MLNGWNDLKKDHISVLLEILEKRLRGAWRPTILLYISCHSRMVFGCPQFLPVDAGRWGDGVSIFSLVRRLSDVVGCGEARIHVMLNGCMEIPGPLKRFIWCLRYSHSQEDFRLSSRRRLLPNSEAQAWMLFACHPGRSVPGLLILDTS